MTVRTHVALDNPYWDEVQTFPNEEFRWNKDRFEPSAHPHLLGRNGRLGSYDITYSRTALVRKYAWSIPSNQTVRWLVNVLDGRDVVEIGAGRGYWASLLSQCGVDVVAYDNVLISLGEENHYFNKPMDGYEALMHEDTTFHDVWRGGPEMAAEHPDKVLFVCWPPYDDPMAFDALRHYAGDTVIYIGEGVGGCTGDDQFHDALSRDFTETFMHAPIQWSGIHDHIYVYERNDNNVIMEQP